MRHVGLLALTLTVALTCHLAHAENWTRFRGSNGTGAGALKTSPSTFSPGDIAWEVELPGEGHSSPVIWENELFVTSAVEEGALRYLHCLDAKTGEKKWSQLVGLNRSHKHLKNSWASSTPATDGEKVYVAFGDRESNYIAAWDFDGELLWRRNLGSFTSQHGQGVSPILFEDMVILPNDQMGPSSVIALDKETGATRWSTLRTHRRTSYATPMILELPNEKPQLICLSGAMGMTSLDPYTGVMNWMTGEFPLRTVASPIYTGKLLLASCGGGGKGKLMIAVDPTEQERADKDRIVWQRDKNLPYVPTPVYHKGHVYLWNDNGVVVCVEADTGKEIWIKRVGGNYSGSPILVGENLYCLNEAGDVIIVGASPDSEDFSSVPLGDGSHSTPATANGRVYFRTFTKLFCLNLGDR